jgi:hypothetical protein
MKAENGPLGAEYWGIEAYGDPFCARRRDRAGVKWRHAFSHVPVRLPAESGRGDAIAESSALLADIHGRLGLGPGEASDFVSAFRAMGYAWVGRAG